MNQLCKCRNVFNFLLGLILFVSFAVGVQSRPIPVLSQRVTDEANLITESSQKEWETILENHERLTTDQVAVLIIPSLEGEILEEYSLKVVESWKLGTKAKDNGVLVLLALEDREVRIEVGYGLEGVLTDVYCNRVIRDTMIPYFKEERYEEGLYFGLKEILKVLETGETPAEPTVWESFKSFNGVALNGEIPLLLGLFMSFLFVGMIFLFAFITAFHKEDNSYSSFVFLLIFFQWIPTMFLGFYGWIICNLIYIFGFTFVRFSRTRIGWVRKLSKKVSDNVIFNGGSGGSSGGWSSGGGSSGGFSGGGGSFGGGGSSGSW